VEETTPTFLAFQVMLSSRLMWVFIAHLHH
jgi:hypothetical protein